MTLHRKPKQERKLNIILGCVAGLALLLHFLPIGRSIAADKVGDSTSLNTTHSSADLKDDEILGDDGEISDLGEVKLMRQIVVEDEGEGLIDDGELTNGELSEKIEKEINLEDISEDPELSGDEIEEKADIEPETEQGEISGAKGTRGVENTESEGDTKGSQGDTQIEEERETKETEKAGEISETKRGEISEKTEGGDELDGGVEGDEGETKGSEGETQGDTKGGKIEEEGRTDGGDEGGDPKAPQIALLLGGGKFNQALSELADLDIIYTITGSVKASRCMNGTIVSDSSSDYVISATYDRITSTVIYCTTAREIYFNADSAGMFEGLTNLTSIKMEDFNTSLVTDMSYMFSRCSSLTSLDLSNFDTSLVTDMSYMFDRCDRLRTIYARFDTSSLRQSDRMFAGDTNLVGGFGTTYYDRYQDATFASPDSAFGPGYFTWSQVYVSFRDSKDREITGEILRIGDTVSAPTIPLRQGEKATWYTDSGYTDEFDFRAPIDKYTRAYLQISCATGYVEDFNGNCVKQVFVTFVANPTSDFSLGHFSGGETTKTLEYRQAPEGYYYAVTEEIQVPNLDPVGDTGYMFEGWYTAPGGSTRWIGLTSGNTATGITLYAKYLPFKDKTVTRDGVTFTIMDRNLGATAVSSGYSYGSNNAQSNTSRIGLYFQWGNNFGFVNNGTLTNVLSNILVNNYTNTLWGPGNYYYNGTYIIKPAEPFYRYSGATSNDNLWGGNSVNNSDTARQGPCPDGYHVPYSTEWIATINLFDKWNTTEDGQTYCNSLTNSGIQYCLPAVLGIPFAGYRAYNTSSAAGNGTQLRVRSADNNNGRSSYILNGSGGGLTVYSTYRAQGNPVRCFKNTENLTLTYDSKGGSSVASRTGFRRWQKRSAPSIPTRAHSTFVGRYKDRRLTEPVVGLSYYVSEDTTLYAKWSCDTGYTDVGNACLDITAPTCTRGQPSKTSLKYGETGSITLTCTDTVGIRSSHLTGGDISLDNPYLTISNVSYMQGLEGGAVTSITYTMVYEAVSDVQGEVVLTLPAGKVSDSAGNGNDAVSTTDYIFQSNGNITICDPDNPTSCITMQDKNLGAINNDITSTGSYGYYYQWGNNHGFESCYESGCNTFPGGETTTYNIQVNTSGYGLGDWYTDPIFRIQVSHEIDWSSPRNDNLRGGSGDNEENNRGLTSTNPIVYRQGPCDTGYHVPSAGEWNKVLEYWGENNGNLFVSDGGLYTGLGYLTSNRDDLLSNFKLPIADERNGANGKIYNDGYLSYWTTSLDPSSEHHEIITLYGDAYYDDLGTYQEGRANALPVRCFKNIPQTFTKSSIITVDATIPDMIFTGDTPAHNSTQSETHFTSQIEITESDLAGFSGVLDGTQTSLYDDSLVLMYNFDKVTSLGESSTVVKDLSKYGNTGTISNSSKVTATSGKWGGAYNFAGGNISVGTDSSLKSRSNFTVSIWIKTTQASDTTYNYFLDRYDHNSNKRVWGFAYRQAKVVVLSSKTGGVNNYSFTSTNTINDGKWHLVTLVHDGSKIQLYIDGVKDKEKEAETLYDTNTPFTIGKTATFRGQLDEVRMYSRALSASEIQELYNSNLAKTDVDKWTYTVEYTGLAAGTHTYGGMAVDTAGNDAAISRTLNIDTTAPTVTLSSRLSGLACELPGYIYTITGVFSEAVTGLDISTLFVTNGTVQSFNMVSGDTAVWTVTINPHNATESVYHFDNDISYTLNSGTAGQKTFTGVGTITVSDGVDMITLLDRNLGAMESGTGCTNSNTGTCGYHFQWGNNYGFSPDVTPVTGSTKVPSSSVNSGYMSQVFTVGNNNWADGDIGNIRGGSTDDIISTLSGDNWKVTNATNRQGPCPDGFHVPSYGEIMKINAILSQNYNSGEFENELLISKDGYRKHGDSNLTSRGSNVYMRTSTPNSAISIKAFKPNLQIQSDNSARGQSIRCIYNQYEMYDPSAIASGDLGSIMIQTGSFTDLYGNTNTDASNIISREYDTQAPATPSMVAEPTYTQGTTNTVSTTGVLDIAGLGNCLSTLTLQYQFCRSTANNTDNCTFSVWSTSKTASFNGLSDGTKYYYFVRARDAYGNISDWSSSTYSTQDNTAPSVSFSPNGGAQQSFGNVTVTVKDTGSRLSGNQTIQYMRSTDGRCPDIWYSIPLSPSTAGSTTATASISAPQGEGDHYLCINSTVSDQVGNKNKSTTTIFTIDTTAPKPEITTTYNPKATTQTASLDCSGAVNGDSYYRGTGSNPSPRSYKVIPFSDLGGGIGPKGKEGEFTFEETQSIPNQTIDSPGTYYLFCKDAAGNISSGSITYHSYRLINMEETVDGNTSSYNINSYSEASSEGPYLYPEGEVLSLPRIYTNPSSGCDSFAGMSIGEPSNSIATLTGTDPILDHDDTTYTMWFTRNTYDLILQAGTGTKNLIGSGTYKWGKDVGINVSLDTGYLWDTWTHIAGTTLTTFTPAQKSQTVEMACGDTTLRADAVDHTLSIFLQATATSAGQTLTINKYFANDYTVDRGDGTTGDLTSDTTHTYSDIGTYTIILSLSGANRWTFRDDIIPLVPQSGTTVTGVQITYMPSLAEGFGNSATTPGSCFFRGFNYEGALTSLPAGSFDTSSITQVGTHFFASFNSNGGRLTSLPDGSFNISNITTVGNYFFAWFNNSGNLASLPGGSFRLSTGLTTVGDSFFLSFNCEGALTSLPAGSFNTSNITTVGDGFFNGFNFNGALTSLPDDSFDISNITTVGHNFFCGFNRGGALTSLPTGSFNISNISGTVAYGFFDSFNYGGALTSLPEGSFNTSNITALDYWAFYAFNTLGAIESLPEGSFNISNVTTVGDEVFAYFNYYGNLTSLSTGSFNTENITTVGSGFFYAFNYGGALTSLPDGSFNISNITTASNSFFSFFNGVGALISLPAGSFNTSNITAVGSEFFNSFNDGGSLTSLPESFTISSVGASVTGGYLDAFNSPDYTLNRNVSDLVSGVTVPLDDRNTFSDNQPGRCGVDPNWLVNKTNACRITYNPNGGNTAITTKNYDSDTTGVVAGSGVTTPTKLYAQFVGRYTGIQTGSQITTVLFPSMDSGTLYAFWSCDTGYKISGDACILNKDIVLQATATSAGQTLKINKYFANDYTVDRGDGTSGDLTGDTTHTYNDSGTYTIILSLTGGASRWTFTESNQKELVPKRGTATTGVKIIYMPSLSEGFGNSATSVGDYFFQNFNNGGALTSLPEGSFDTSNITTVGNRFFENFNYGGELTSLPAGSFRLSTGLTTVGGYFFDYFNNMGKLTSLPDGSFNISNIKTVGVHFFYYFNGIGKLTSLPTGSFDTSNIIIAGNNFFEGFNDAGALTSLPELSFRLSTGLTTVGDNFFYKFNYRGKLTSLPANSFDTSNITTVGNSFFASFNYTGSLTRLPELSFRLSTGLTTVGNGFFSLFNDNGGLTSLPTGSFNTENITTVGSSFFASFNRDGSLTSLPTGSFNISNISGTVGNFFFASFNRDGSLTSLPANSFDTPNITTVGSSFFYGFNQNGRITSLPATSFDTSNITTVGDYFFDSFNRNGSLTSLPATSFDTSNITTVGNSFFRYFNDNGGLTSLPANSFDTSNITTVGNSFFASFNYSGSLTSLPDGSFNMSNITSAGTGFFSGFNYIGRIRQLPNSFTISSVGASTTSGYRNAFRSSNFNLNRNVSDLVSGVTVPLDDRNTFSDNQPGRCGVDPNWLVNKTNACRITYNPNGGNTAITTKNYDSDTTGVVAGFGVVTPTKPHAQFVGRYTGIQTGSQITTVLFPSMDSGTLYAYWSCEAGYTLVNNECVDITVPTVVISSNGSGMCNTSTTYTVTGIFSETMTGLNIGSLTVLNGVVQSFNMVSGDTAVWTVTKSGSSDFIRQATVSGVNTISICDPNDSTKCITMMDRNLGAENNDINSTGSYGYHYQWGNNHEFEIGCWTDGCSDRVTSNATKEQARWLDSFGNHGYDGPISDFMKGSIDYWYKGEHYGGLWGGAGDSEKNNRGYDENNNVAFNVTGRQGPCPEGYHVPSIGEWSKLLEYWAANYTGEGNELILTDNDGLKLFNDKEGNSNEIATHAAGLFKEDFKIPSAGSRNNYDAKVNFVGGDAGLWSSSPTVGNARYFYLYPYAAYANGSDYPAYGHSLRCFQNSYLSFPSGDAGTVTVIIETGAVSDLAGNANTEASNSITWSYDDFGPTGSIAVTYSGSDTYATGTTFTLTLSASDEGCNNTVSQMQFSCDGTSWSTPEAFATTKTFSLADYSSVGCTVADGLKTISVRYTDGFGNTGDAYSDSIIVNRLGIILQATATDSGQTLKINKYFNNAYTVDRGDGTSGNLTSDTTHTYSDSGVYTIVLSLSGADRWTFQNIQNPLVPRSGTMVTGVKITYMPSLAEGFGDSATAPGDYFFAYFNGNKLGASDGGVITTLPAGSFDTSSITTAGNYFFAYFNAHQNNQNYGFLSLPAGSFDISNITTVGDYFFSNFNWYGRITSLPVGSFRLSTGLTTVRNHFFSSFNSVGQITSLPVGSFNTENIITVGDYFFSSFNYAGGALTSLPVGSFNTENITTVGDYFFSHFNAYGGRITSLPVGSFRLSTGLTTVGNHFFYYFNGNEGQITSLPVGSFNTENITTVGNNFFSYFSYDLSRITSLPAGSFRLSTGLKTVGDYFFYGFNQDGRITSLPTGSFDTSNITTVGNNFFSAFNGDDGQLTSLPAGSFRLSTGLTTVGDSFFSSFNGGGMLKGGELTSLPVGSFNTENITTGGNNFFSSFNRKGNLTSLPDGSFRLSTGLTTVGDGFFNRFNDSGQLTSLPVGSFNTSKITTAGTYFFSNFNNGGSLTSLPEGSFDTSNITTAGNYFFYYFNYSGSLTNLPDSFKLTSAAYNKTNGYTNAFNSPNYTLNKNVSDLVSGVVAPNSDRNTFSDNQPGRCGVADNWLLNPATSCDLVVTFNTNSGDAIPSMSANNGGKIVLPEATRQWYNFVGWYTGNDNNLISGGALYTVTGNVTFNAKWQETKHIVLQATATSANQTLKINKYFANAYTVDRGDGTTGNLTSDTTHTYNTAGTYTITLSLSGASRWTFQSVNKPLVPKTGTTMTGVQITYMPSLADGFGNSATAPGHNFFRSFNDNGALISLPAGSFDTSSIMTVRNNFFTQFNRGGLLTSLPAGSFDTSNISGTVGDGFFWNFNWEGNLTSLPEGSFKIDNITSVGNNFFRSFNSRGSLTSLPEGSFKIDNITSVGNNFFNNFNSNGSLTSLPGGSFRLSTGLTTAGNNFFSNFNNNGSLTSLPGGSFDTSNITTVGNVFFSNFNEYGALESLPEHSFDISNISGAVGYSFFFNFNYGGELTSLPTGSFNISNITSADSGFFHAFNFEGKITELPEGSFDTSNLTSVGENFFAYFNMMGGLISLPSGSFNLSNITSSDDMFLYAFNYEGKITELPDSFTISSVGASVTGGYDYAFYSSDYTINKGVYDLVSGVTVPLYDKDVFSDNQPRRCGVHENWLDTTADACRITYDSNGGSTIANPTQLYTADTTSVVAGSGVTTPTRVDYEFVGRYTGIQSGSLITTVLFPEMDSGTLYAHWRETVPPTVVISSDGAGMCAGSGDVYTVTGSFSEAVTGIDASTLTVINGTVQDFQVVSGNVAVWTVGKDTTISDYIYESSIGGINTLTICDPNDSGACITMMDRNLGAENNDITSTGSYGYYYQWGNNYGFEMGCRVDGCVDGVASGAINGQTGSNGFGPSTPYNDGTYYYGYGDWSNTRNNNLRGGTGDDGLSSLGYDIQNNVALNVTGRQGPCDTGYHVPSIGEWNKVLEYWAQENIDMFADERLISYNNRGLLYLSNCTGEYSCFDANDVVVDCDSEDSVYVVCTQLDNTIGQKFQTDFKIPVAGRRFYSDAKIRNLNSNAYLWSSSPREDTESARGLYLASDAVRVDSYNRRASALTVRCFKNEPIVPTSSTGYGTVTVMIETGAVVDLAGNANTDASNTISREYDDAGPEFTLDDVEVPECTSGTLVITGITQIGCGEPYQSRTPYVRNGEGSYFLEYTSWSGGIGSEIVTAGINDSLGNYTYKTATITWTDTAPTANDFSVDEVGTYSEANWIEESEATDGDCGVDTLEGEVIVDGTQGHCEIDEEDPAWLMYYPDDGASGSDSCTIMITDDEGSTGTFTVTWNDIYRPNPQVLFVSPTPASGSVLTTNKFTAKAEISDVENITNLYYELYDLENDNTIVSGSIDPSSYYIFNFDNVTDLGEVENETVVSVGMDAIGTVYGATRVSSGRYGGAYSFDGVDDYIDLGVPSSSAYSIVLWAKPRSLFGTQLGERKHLVYTYNPKVGGKGLYYVNGKSYGSTMPLELNGVFGSNSIIGKNKALKPTYFAGLIDEVRVYPRVISADEVQYLYNSNLRKTGIDTWEFETINSCLDMSGMYEYTVGVTSDIDTYGEDARTISTQISVSPNDFSVDGVGFDRIDVNWIEEAGVSEFVCGDYTLEGEVIVDGTQGECVINGDLLEYYPYDGASGSDTCTILVTHSDGNTGEFTVTWNDIYRPIPEIIFLSPTPEDGAEWTQNRFTTKVQINNVEYLDYAEYLFNQQRNSLLRPTYLYNFEDIADMGEVTDEFVEDARGNAEGEVYGATRVSSGRYGGAYSFDGVDDYISFNGFPDEYTLVARVKPEGGEWTQFVATYDGNHEYYIDGILTSILNLPDSYKKVFGDGDIGRGLRDEYFNGLIDEFQIYDYALSQDEIQNLYKSNLRRTSMDTWEFEIINTCLMYTGEYEYGFYVESDIGTWAETGRVINTNIPLVTISGTGYDFGVHVVTGSDRILTGTMGTLTVTDYLGYPGSDWGVYLTTSPSLVGVITQDTIDTDYLGFKATDLIFSGLYEGYLGDHVYLRLDTESYSSAKGDGQEDMILEYVYRGPDSNDFMCGDVGTYSDDTQIQLEVPARQSPDTYIGTLWITLRDETEYPEELEEPEEPGEGREQGDSGEGGEQTKPSSSGLNLSGGIIKEPINKK